MSIIAASLNVTGNLESDDEILVYGTVNGDVRGNRVTIGDGAKVTGTVRGDVVKVGGTVDGRIEARNVVLAGTAHFVGDIVHETLQIEPGAHVDSRSRPDYGNDVAGPTVIDAQFEVEEPEDPATRSKVSEIQAS